MPLTPHLDRTHPVEFAECLADGVAGALNRAIRIPMGAADGLGDDDIDDAQRLEVLGGDLHAGCGVDARAESRHRMEAAASGEATV